MPNLLYLKMSTVTEMDFVALVPVTDTTIANDIFKSGVSVSTHGTPSMVGDKDGEVFKWRKFRLFSQSKCYGTLTAYYIRRLCATRA